MKVMKSMMAGAVLLTAAAVHAEIINVNFSDRGAVDVSAGVSAPQGNVGGWNNIGNGGTYSNLLDSAGLTTAVGLTVAGGDFSDVSAALEISKAYQYFGGGATSVGMTTTIFGLGADSEWDVYLMSQGNADGRTTRFGLGTGSIAAGTDILDSTPLTSFTTVTTWTEGGNYVKYASAIADASGNLTIEGASLSGNNNGSLNGIQLVAIPEPATFGLFAAFGGAVLFVRRRFML